MKKKTVIVICLLLAMVFSFHATALSLGDLNSDGKITAADARTVLRAAVGLERFVTGSAEYAACDLNCDSKVTAADARIVLRIAVGLDHISNYASGNSSGGGNSSSGNGERSVPGLVTNGQTGTYVVNVNTGKFHYPTCRSVTDMSAKNRADSNASREELVACGFAPCGICKP